MASSIKPILIVAFCLASCSASGEASRAQPRQADSPAPTSELTALGHLPASDALEGALRNLTTQFKPRESLWRQSEKRVFSRLLASARFDTLVLPAQVHGNGFSHSERSLMSAELTYALAARGVKVPDPYLVSRALGEGLRKLDPADVDALARSLGVKRIIVLFVGHDGRTKLFVTLRVHEAAARALASTGIAPRDTHWRAVAFTDERPPSAVFHDLLPSILKTLQLSPNPKSPPRAPAAVFRYPETPATAVAVSAISMPIRFAILGALAPSRAERARERLFEQALLSLDAAALPADEARLLHAYVLFKLGHRPAGLATLKELRSPAGAALRAIIDGNLTGTEVLVAKTSGYQRLLLEIELHDLATAYLPRRPALPLKELETLARLSPAWQVLLAHRLADLDSWAVGDNRNLKLLLDELYPVPGFDLAALTLAQEQPGSESYSETSLEAAVLQHYRKWLSLCSQESCGTSASLQPRARDVLELIEGHAEANMIKAVWRMAWAQGLEKEALSYLKAIEADYLDHPAFTALRAAINKSLGSKATVEHKERYKALVRDDAERALYWSQGLSETSRRAIMCLLPEDALLAENFARVYARDYPLRAGWLWHTTSSIFSQEERLALAREALKFESASLYPVEELISVADPAVRSEVSDALEYRFSGHPQLGSMRESHRTAGLSAEERKEFWSPRSLQARWSQGIKDEPEQWLNYLNLAASLMQTGDYQRAVDIAGSYPGFKNSSGYNSVALSNYAYDVASQLYWRGAFEHAGPLNEIAAGLDNGSEASIAAQYRLHVVDGDFDSARPLAEYRAARYPSTYSYRDNLMFQHATDSAETAWAVFDRISNTPEGPAVWQAALTGHRRARKSDSDVMNWVRDRVRGSDDPRLRRYGAQFAVLWYATDRTPTTDLAAIVRDLAGDPSGVTDGEQASYPSLQTPGQRYDTGPSTFRAGTRTTPPNGTRVDSDITLFAGAYAALRTREFLPAVERFDALAARYLIETYMPEGSAEYALAYLAYASAKTGDPLQLEAYLASNPAGGPGSFDLQLARAFIAGGHGKADEALAFLRRASYLLPYVEWRPILPDYQLVEACEWLYEDLKDPRILRLALDLADRFKRVQPFHAWPYAFVARYANDPAQRRDALRIAVYLDPRSMRLSGIAARELAEASAWARNAKPFGNWSEDKTVPLRAASR